MAKKRDFPPCLLCQKQLATKTNSHIIPSFMIAPVCNYDGSIKRGKEVIFTMSTYEDKVYTGEIPDTKYEELFDMKKMTDERIENELKDNTAAKDYIFCPDCEKALSVFLESPYGDFLRSGKKIDDTIAYFFWLSVVWRMSISNQFNFRLPFALEQHLGERLHTYLEAMKACVDTKTSVSSCLFRYRLLASPDYLSDERFAGYFGGRFDYKRNILSMTMGDRILCVTFNEDPLPNDYFYLGFEKELRDTPVNKGQQNEQVTILPKERFAEGIHQMVKETARKRLHNEKEVADAVWRQVGLPGVMPRPIFVSLIERLYSQETKQGDRKTKERYVEVFEETLKSYGFISID